MQAVLVCISFICITNVFVHSKQNNKSQCNIQTKTVKNKLFPLVGKSREKRQTCKEYGVVHTNFRTYFKSLMANYSNYVPPYYPSKGWQRVENFVLDIRMQPEALVDLNDVDERMTTGFSFLVEWKESNLVWAGMNTFVYSVILDADMLWKPHIKLGNPHASQRVMTDTNDKLILEFKGEVTWSFVWTVDTRCKIDITYYPFDRQYCLIDLVLSSDLKEYLNFDHIVPHLALDNGNWKHINTSIYNYTNYKTMKTHIVIEYTFDRKPVTPMLVFMAPVTILVSLLPLVFVLPNDGSERLGIAMTVLLAVSVYMTLVVDKLPDSSDPLPLITTVFFAWYVYNAFVTLLVLINGHISRISDKRSVPKCLQCLVRLTRRCFCLADKNYTCVESRNEENAQCEENKMSMKKITWKSVSSMLDKWFIILLYALEIVYASVAFVVLTSGGKDGHIAYRVPGDFMDDQFKSFTGEGQSYECALWE